MLVVTLSQGVGMDGWMECVECGKHTHEMSKTAGQWLVLTRAGGGHFLVQNKGEIVELIACSRKCLRAAFPRLV